MYLEVSRRSEGRGKLVMPLSTTTALEPQSPSKKRKIDCGIV